MNSTARAAAKALLTTVNRPLARRRTDQLIRSAAPPYRVELGTSTVRHASFIPTDVSWRTKYWLDATKPWPVPKGTVSHAYGDNMIEHVSIDGARSAFRHAHEAMISGGRLRLVTPDVERVVRMYLEGGDLLTAQTERNRRHGYRVDHPVSLLRTVFVECGHHEGFVWDFTSLSYELGQAGFVKIERCEVGNSPDPVFRGLESRTEAVDQALYLVVEAVRP